MMKISGFVPQQDLTLDCLTVNEHLQLMVIKKTKNKTKNWRNGLQVKLFFEGNN